MKVIGKTDGGYILEATQDEVANILGYYYSGNVPNGQVQIGGTINIAKMYQQLYRLRDKPEMKSMAARLRVYADAMEQTGEFAEMFKVGPNGKEE